MKTCRVCLEPKALSEFSTREGSPDGLVNRCKKCVTEHMRQWRESHPQKAKAADTNRYLRNKTEHNARSLTYYQTHKQRRLSRFKEYRLENLDRERARAKRRREGASDHVRAKRRAHYAANKVRYVAQAKAREARKAHAMPSWANAKIIEAIYAEAARLTSTTGIVHHVDHVIPLNGKNVCGLHVESNLAILTAKENLMKSNHFSAGA